MQDPSVRSLWLHQTAQHSQCPTWTDPLSLWKHTPGPLSPLKLSTVCFLSAGPAPMAQFRAGREEGSSGGHGHKQGLGTDLEEGNNGFPGGSVVKNSPANAGDSGSIPGSGRYPGEGNGNPLQYSCLRNPMDRGVWRATIQRVTKSWT